MNQLIYCLSFFLACFIAISLNALELEKPDCDFAIDAKETTAAAHLKGNPDALIVATKVTANYLSVYYGKNTAQGYEFVNYFKNGRQFLKHAIGADMNNDGLDDLVGVMNLGFSYKPRLANGGFGKTSVVYARSNSYLAVGDVNGDSNLDVITTNAMVGAHYTNSISVFFGNGNGGFSEEKFIRLKDTRHNIARSISVDRINGNKDVIALIAEEDISKVVLLYVDNNGNLESKTMINTQAKGHMADLVFINVHSTDRGKKDLVAVSGPGEKYIGYYKNNGNGTLAVFSQQNDYGTNGLPRMSAIALKQGGIEALSIPGTGSNSPEVLLKYNEGNKRFEEEAKWFACDDELLPPVSNCADMGAFYTFGQYDENGNLLRLVTPQDTNKPHIEPVVCSSKVK